MQWFLIRVTLVDPWPAMMVSSVALSPGDTDAPLPTSPVSTPGLVPMLTGLPLSKLNSEANICHSKFKKENTSIWLIKKRLCSLLLHSGRYLYLLFPNICHSLRPPKILFQTEVIRSALKKFSDGISTILGQKFEHQSWHHYIYSIHTPSCLTEWSVCTKNQIFMGS